MSVVEECLLKDKMTLNQRIREGCGCRFGRSKLCRTSTVRQLPEGPPTEHPSTQESHPAYEQRWVDLASFRAVPASTWGHCPQVLVFTIVWDTPGKETVAKWSSAPASILGGFNEIYVVYGPPKKTL